MSDRVPSAASLLSRAEGFMNAQRAVPGLGEAVQLLKTSGGAAYMKQVMEWERGQPIPRDPSCCRSLVFVKYAACVTTALPLLLLMTFPWNVLLGGAAFYLVEAQLVFLIPLAIDGAARPFSESLAMTRVAGGTFHVVTVVVPIAARMIFGRRCHEDLLSPWCAGCAAIACWYESLRNYSERSE